MMHKPCFWVYRERHMHTFYKDSGYWDAACNTEEKNSVRLDEQSNMTHE